MQSHVEDAILDCRSQNAPKKKLKRSSDVTNNDAMDGSNQSFESHSNQLVIYDPGTSHTCHDALAVTNLKENCILSFGNLASNASGRTLPSIGTFTVQCASCFKWRIIPQKEKYEQIRENILEEPFVCEHAQEWRPDIACEDPEDISQDGSRLWAIDKPSIAKTPPGWERLLRIRGEGGTKFADVYYSTPSGKRLRSMVEIQRYLLEHPEHAVGLKLSQFSFQSPRPLHENYVRRRPVRLSNSCIVADVRQPSYLEYKAPPEKEHLLGKPASSNAFPQEEPVTSSPNETTGNVGCALSQQTLASSSMSSQT